MAGPVGAVLLVQDESQLREQPARGTNLLFNIITLVIRTAQTDVVVRDGDSFSPRLKVQRVLRVLVVHEAQATDNSVSSRPPELREDLRVRRDGWRGVLVG